MYWDYRNPIFSWLHNVTCPCVYVFAEMNIRTQLLEFVIINTGARPARHCENFNCRLRTRAWWCSHVSPPRTMRQRDVARRKRGAARGGEGGSRVKLGVFNPLVLVPYTCTTEHWGYSWAFHSVTVTASDLQFSDIWARKRNLFIHISQVYKPFISG